jgi:hypothetical protein
VSRPFAARLLVLLLASSAGVHAALVPVHAVQTPALGALFALSTLGLAGVALSIDRVPGRTAAACAALLLGSLLAAYTATRLVALPPFTQREPVDVLGATTKLAEATALVLALRLFAHPRTAHLRRPPYLKELAHEQHHSER